MLSLRRHRQSDSIEYDVNIYFVIGVTEFCVFGVKSAYDVHVTSPQTRSITESLGSTDSEIEVNKGTSVCVLLSLYTSCTTKVF